AASRAAAGGQSKGTFAMAHFEHGIGSREVQDRFDTRRLADAISSRTVHDVITERDRAFIERMDMFFIASQGANGNLDCSYKGGEPGFVKVLDEHTVAFPNYDGNGQYMTAGNIIETGRVGLLFIDFQNQWRMRLNGTASIDFDDPLKEAWPEAQFVVRVHAEEVFPNCPRYIHKMELVERSVFVPRAGCETPDPDWKDHFEDALPAEQQRRRATRRKK
ncbi:MAG TPA: pyridoxamine 5'-phosphate oxidase family protein, partial [Tepidiformaceae bacterium]|nr:pyridoxamine 5'-phosphate oxidase family protein [Tepidiformaceae bacterium]